VNRRRLVKAAVLVATLLGLALAVETFGLRGILDKDWIDANVRGHGLQGLAVFVGLGGVCVAVGLPRQLLGFLGGYAFGIVDGTAVGVAGSTLGCILAFTYARALGRDSVQRRFPNRARKIDAFLADNPFAMTVLIRFLPVGSNLLTNLLAGVSSVSATAFILGSAVGYVPQTLIAALVGAGIDVESGLHIAVAAALFVGSGVIAVYIARKTRRARLIAPDIAGNGGEGSDGGAGDNPAADGPGLADKKG
jgi:uncharacterized membrane protein YdjX (TVP38/TMEM64 family)